MSKFKKVIIGLVIAIIAIPIVGFGALYFKLNSMYDKEGAKQVNDKIKKVDETNGITNILLAGIDGNNMDKGKRSDAMMILTIDSKNNDIRLTSLARDTYADIPGYGKEKLTHAYAYGGPSLLLEAIDKNFDVPIDKYVVVSFESFTKIIDVLGGIQIDVLDREVSHIPGLKGSGLQTLDGAQALAYSRIRYADDAFHRDNRQRTVIEALYSKLLSDFSSSFMEVANDIIGYTKTNLTPMEIMSIATKVIKINDDKFEQMEFPLEGHRNGYVMNKEKGYIIEWDEAYNKDKLHKFIFDYKNFNK